MQGHFICLMHSFPGFFHHWLFFTVQCLLPERPSWTALSEFIHTVAPTIQSLPFQPQALFSCSLLVIYCSSVPKMCLTVTPWTAAHQSPLPSTISQSLLKLMSFELMMHSKHLILCCLLMLPPSIFPTTRVFSNELAIPIRWPKDWSFSFIISPSNEYSGLISFRIGWFDFLAVQGTFKSLLQHHNSKASILQHSAFVMIQLSHPYMTAGKP